MWSLLEERCLGRKPSGCSDSQGLQYNDDDDGSDNYIDNGNDDDFLSYIFDVSEKYKDYTFDYDDLAV